MSMLSSRRSWVSTLAAGLTTGLAAALCVPVLAAAPAAADTPPAIPAGPATVSADALPTVQINGVVWSQVVVGNRVYATGQFTSARPAGAPAGTSETARSNILAYDLTTGALITSWAPSLNGTGQVITASPDGTRLYVGGDFSTANGVSHNHLVALDATTGAVVTAFKGTANARVRALAAVGSTVYAGGAFTAASGQARSRLAAFGAADGALLPWAPAADAEVFAMTAPAGAGELVVGGRLSTLNGETHLGMGALDLTTGATLPWAASDLIQNYGPKSAIYSLSSDGTRVYGTAYDYYGPSDFENAFAADPAGGAISWLNGCFGDTYSNVPLGGVLYTVGHAHDCSAIGGHPDTDPRTFQRAQAFDAAGGNVNRSGQYSGRPAARILPWLPTLSMGSYTGQSQAAWSVTGNSSYVALGGEFPAVNGRAQQGLVRFAVRSVAPNKEGPQTTGAELQPSLVSLYPGTVRATWKAAWDRDDRTLAYELLRGSSTTSATVVASSTADSAWWSRPNQLLTDPGAPAGSTQTYRVRVTDPSGNTVVSPATTITVPAATTQGSAYRDAVRADGASDYWRLDEPSGTGSYDWVGADDLTLDSSAVRGRDGATADGDTATAFSGSATVPAVTPSSRPAPDTFTAEAWIRTTTTTGGKVIGYGDSATGSSSNYDRQVYMGNDGRLSFGVYSGGTRTVTSARAYNDGQWHHVVASLSGVGTVLYVDGVRVAHDTSVTSGQPFSGYWRIGGDSLGGWPNQPSSNAFAGDIDDVAIYPTALSQQTVLAHYTATGRTSTAPTRPTDPYGAAVWDSSPDSFWRLEDTSGATVADSTANGAYANLVGGPTLGAAGVQGTHGASLDGADDTIVSSTPVSNPTLYSLEMWFKTTTTRGGKLIGLGDAASGRSSNYDRQVYMYDDGRLSFDTWSGGGNRADSPTSYNDGAWHHLVATQGAGGMVLYVDGAAVATNAATGAQDYTGYWRVGGDGTWGGASSDWFAGSVDEVATYSSVLDAATVAGHFTKGGGNLAPTAAFTASASDLTATFDASASADADGTVASYGWDFGDGTPGTGAKPSHPYAAAGTYQVVLTVTDDKGATGTVTHPVTVAPPRPARPADAYGAAVYDAGAQSFWRLEETSGTSAADSSGSTPGTLQGGASLGAAGTKGSRGVGLDGNDGTIVSSTAVTSPNQYSLEMWFSTTTPRGGRLIGFGNNPSGSSSSYDRQVWMTDDGRLSFGTWTGQTNVASSTASYNDGTWHHLVATQGPAGLVLHVDGKVVGTNPQTGAQDYTGYWRVGGDNTWGGNSSNYFAGTVDEVAVYPSQLDDATVTDHFTKGSTAVNAAPTAAFTSAVKDLGATFDASGSSDADGSVAAYAWDFGDGTTGTGVTPTHTYTAAGTVHVTLTVTDDEGATASVAHDVTVSAPVPTNQAPTASFTSSVKDLGAAFDASASADADGSVASYAWDFGDGSAATGKTATHTYAAAGTFQVTLTVTDDKGAKGTLTQSVAVTTPVPANQAPTARFTASTKDLGAMFDATASSDPDGSVRATAWDFGDGATGSGTTAQHTYAAAGTYQVTLAVTDDAGATSSVTHAVTVTAPVPVTSTALAKDSFARTVSGGLGSADTGGAWTLAGAASNFAVSGGAAQVKVASAGGTSAAYLGGVSSTDTDVRASFALDEPATGGGTYLSLIGRRVGTSDYRAKLRVASDGTVSVTLEKVAGGVETSFKAVTVTGVKYAVGQQLLVRLQVVGTAPTALNAKVWLAGTAEPASWTATATDTTAALQAAGGLGVLAYLSGSATNAPVTLAVRDLLATTSGAAAPAPAPVNAAPTAAFTSTVKDLSASFDASASADADGTVASYGWDFGDGTPGTGAKPSHPYAAAGTYQVVLTVTDDKGATGTVTHPVTATAPPATGGDPGTGGTPAAGTTVAKDSFARTVTGGLGTAETGGAWTVATGAASSFAVDGQTATITVPKAGANTAVVLSGVATTSVDLTSTVRADQAGTGGGTYLYSIGRRTSAGDYRARVRLLSDGRVALALTRWTPAGETVLGGEVVVTGLTGAPGTVLHVRLQVTGTAPTALHAKVWADGSPEPTVWQREATDSTAGFQVAGSIGFAAYLSTSSTSAPTVLRLDDLLAVQQ